jgi:beta-galactosidase
MYEGIRKLGFDVDIVHEGMDLSGYKLLIAPSLPIVRVEFATALRDLHVPVLLGPRSGSKTENFSIAPQLPPGNLSSLLDMMITRVESFAPYWKESVHVGARKFHGLLWREHISTSLAPLATFSDGSGAWYRQNHIDYIATWPDRELLSHILSDLALRAGLEPQSRELGVRTRDRGAVRFAFNYSTESRRAPAPANAKFLLGSHEMPPASLSAWRHVP